MMDASYDNRYKWRALALLWVAFFLQQGMRQIYGPLLGSIRTATGASDVELGRVAAIFTLLYGLCIPFAGFAADVFRRKWMVTAGVAIFSAGIFSSGYVSTVGLLIFTYGVVNGIGQPFYYPSSTSLIAQLHSDTKATALSILQLAMYVGIIGCSGLAGWFADLGADGWRMPFRVLGALGLVWAIVLAFLLKDTRPARASGSAGSGAQDRVTIGQAVKAMFAKPAAVLIALALGMEVYVDVGFKTWMPNYLTETFGVGKASAGFNAVFGGRVVGNELCHRDSILSADAIHGLFFQDGVVDKRCGLNHSIGCREIKCVVGLDAVNGRRIVFYDLIFSRVQFVGNAIYCFVGLNIIIVIFSSIDGL